jgi:hypothetical protein
MFDILYYPGMKESEAGVYIQMPSAEYFNAISDILNPDRRKIFVQNYIWDVSASSDDKPFFSYYFKTGNIRDIYKNTGQKWQYFVEEGYILPFVFIQGLILSLIFMILPVLSKKHRDSSIKSLKKTGKGGFSHSLLFSYFACIGIGFMFIEVSFIQKVILPLEHPSYAFATMLTSLLMSAGFGSLFRQRFSFLKNPSILIALSLIAIAYSILISPISDQINPYSLPVKILLIYIAFIPMGFFMGIPFPNGLILLGEKNDTLIPWAWAINGCFSVLSPILAIMIATAFGFTTVLWLGAGMYLLAYFFYKFSTRPF